ncbi:MAG: hypothetical protein AAB817_00030 [Patescibacteria group bacterium]
MSTTSPTLTGDLRRGDETQVLVALQGDGVQPEDYAAIGKNNALRSDVVAAIIKHRLLTPPEEQAKKFLELNAALWRDPAITAEVIAALGVPPTCPVSDESGLYCVALFYDTGDAVETFRRNWEACIQSHGQDGTWKWGGLLFTPEGVRPRANAKPRSRGLRWQVCELGRAYQKQSVESVRPQLDRGQIMGMGQEGPMLAALHPKWVTSMDGGVIPYMDMPDLEVSPGGGGDFVDAPYLGFVRGDRRVYLDADGVREADPGCGSGSLR